MRDTPYVYRFCFTILHISVRYFDPRYFPLALKSGPPNCRTRVSRHFVEAIPRRVFTRALVISLRAPVLALPRPSLPTSPVYFASVRLVRDKSQNHPDRLSLFTPSLLPAGRDTRPPFPVGNFPFCRPGPTIVVSGFAGHVISRVVTRVAVLSYRRDRELNKETIFFSLRRSIKIGLTRLTNEDAHKCNE